MNKITLYNCTIILVKDKKTILDPSVIVLIYRILE